jgi:hypothetical protein
MISPSLLGKSYINQYPMDKLANHGVTRNRLYWREIHPNKLMEVFCTLL